MTGMWPSLHRDFNPLGVNQNSYKKNYKPVPKQNALLLGHNEALYAQHYILIS